MQELRVIQEFLGRVRQHLLRRRLMEASVAHVLGAGMLLVVLVALSALIAPESSVWTVFFWLGFGALSVGLWGGYWFATWCRTRHVPDLARDIERHDPDLRNDLVTALDFGGALEEPERLDQHTSVVLVKAHMLKTARSTERYRDRLDTLYTQRSLKPAQWAAGGLVALLLVSASLFPNLPRYLGNVLFGPKAPSAQGATTVDGIPVNSDNKVLLVRNLSMTVTFPTYTGLRPQRMPITDGRLRVYSGTHVALRGLVSIKEPKSVTLIYESEEGKVSETKLKLKGNRLRGEFTVFDPGTYRFRVTSADDVVLDNDVERSVEILPDQPAVVEINRPRGELEVSATDRIKFEVEASDDFGLTEVALVAYFEGDDSQSDRQVIAKQLNQMSLIKEHELDLAKLTFEIQPKDRIVVVAEAVDNDPYGKPQAPKSSFSKEVILRITSPEDRHEALLKKEEEIFEAFLLLLADYQEMPIYSDEPGQRDDDGTPDTFARTDLTDIHRSAESINTRRQLVLEMLRKYLDEMAKDPLMLRRDYEQLTTLRETHYTLHRDAVRNLEAAADIIRDQRRRGLRIRNGNPALTQGRLDAAMRKVGDHRLKLVDATERAVIELEELIASQWQDAMQMTINQIRKLRDELKDKLRAYKDAQDPQLKKEIMRDIARLKKRMDELQARLSQQAQQMPQEFLNAEAFKEAAEESNEDLSKGIQDLESMLASGDIDGALAALDNLDKQLESMLSMLDQNTAGGGGNGMSRLDQQANELMDAINDVATAQSELEGQSAKLSDQIRQRQQDALKQELDPLIAEQRSRLDGIQKQLDDIAKANLNPAQQAQLDNLQQTIDNTRRNLDLKSIDDAKTGADRMQSQADNAQQQVAESKSSAPQGQQPALDQAGEKLGAISKDAAAMSQELQSILDKATPTPGDQDSGQMQQLAQGQQRVRQRADALQQKLDTMAQEFPDMKDKLQPSLDQAKQFMDGAQGKLDQMQLSPGLEDERQALRALRAMKRSAQQSLQQERMGDGQGRDQNQERVEIPERDKSAPKEFREDLLDAMKEQGLPAFEDENKLYYKSLVN